MDGPWKPQLLTIDEVDKYAKCPHHNCPALELSGGEDNCYFAIEFDAYQLDDLEKVSYTMVEELCVACYGFSDIVVRIKKAVPKKRLKD